MRGLVDDVTNMVRPMLGDDAMMLLGKSRGYLEIQGALHRAPCSSGGKAHDERGYTYLERLLLPVCDWFRFGDRYNWKDDAFEVADKHLWAIRAAGGLHRQDVSWNNLVLLRRTL